MYDFELISEILGISGFTNATRCSFMTGEDPTLLIDAHSRKAESLYVEAEAAEYQGSDVGSEPFSLINSSFRATIRR
jgi:hypothetical protein